MGTCGEVNKTRKSISDQIKRRNKEFSTIDNSHRRVSLNESNKKSDSYFKSSSNSNYSYQKKNNKNKPQISKEENNFLIRALKIHNKFRKKHKAKDLNLNDELCEIANSIAEQCAENESPEHIPLLYNEEIIGENISIIKNNNFNVEKIIENWYEEKNNYKFDSNKYINGTGHFTQLVWKSSKEVGFGFKESSNRNIYFVANYYPAGNIFNEFIENVKDEIKY